MRNSILAAAAILVAAPGVVSAAERPCLTRSEFTDLAGFTLPSVISGASARCEPELGPEAYLTTDGDALVERYSARMDASWPAAKVAFLKLSSKTSGEANDLIKLLPDETLQEMLELMLQGMVSQEIPPKYCGTIDEFARLLSPLSPENTAEILALIVDLTAEPKMDGSGNSAIGKLSICQD